MADDCTRKGGGCVGKVIVFGSLNMDLSIESDRMPRMGETIQGRHFIANPGGKGANQAVAAARLGSQTYMVGAVGDDMFGRELVDGLRSSGVDCRFVRSFDGTATGTAMIIRTDGDNRIVLGAGANHVIGQEDVAQALDAISCEGDVFVTQYECDKKVTLSALHLARERGLFTLFNPAPAMSIPDESFADIDLLCLNETECEAICGLNPSHPGEAVRAMKELRRRGAQNVVITLGARGAMASSGGAVSIVHACQTTVLDTTGAGDTFIGATAHARSAGLGEEEGLRLASAASALAVSRLGAQQSIPSAEEVRSYMEGME
jgi:ribokinase